VLNQIGTIEEYWNQFEKLKPKYYGSFKVIEKIGALTYKLNLPIGSSIHLVFHVSQIKKCHGPVKQTTLTLPVLSPGGKWRIEPLSVLDRRVVKKRNAAHVEILVKW
jgi:hypothetical protein